MESILADYGSTDSFQDVVPFILSPFDCLPYGDLCNEVGPIQAEVFVCNRWDEARAGETTAAIAAAGDAELDTMIDTWFDSRFPDGVPASHPWWGTVTGDGLTAPPSSSSECVTTKTYETYDEDTRYYYRVRSHSWYVRTYVYNWIGASAKSLRSSTGSSWSRYSGNVEVDNDYRSKRDPSDAYWSCPESDSGSDSDGYVSRGDSRVLHYPHERVNSAAILSQGWMISTGTCKTAPWTDPDCD
ncbi:MAG: hypothetical protein D6798_12865 [Deltaproteobacteria bacterium]|nr:MAG: hypothetical protein D6798_12865 [Deltaproteobacteria bacterium]